MIFYVDTSGAVFLVTVTVRLFKFVCRQTMRHRPGKHIRERNAAKLLKIFMDLFSLECSNTKSCHVRVRRELTSMTNRNIRDYVEITSWYSP